MAFASTMIVLLGLLVAPAAMAYPQYWAQEYAPNCAALPTKSKDCHKTPIADATTVIIVLDAGKPVKAACAGKAYTVAVTFPAPRLAYLTLGSSAGAAVSAKTAYNKRCPNTMTFSGTPGKTASVAVVAPSAPGRWQLGVASATGMCSPFYITTATVPVAKC